MSVVGKVNSVWRYPVKSMRGEELDEIIVRQAGVEGDRLFAIRNSAARAEFPYFTGREQREMLLYRPKIRAETEKITVDVQTPTGDTIAIDDPALLTRLAADRVAREQLSLMLPGDGPFPDAYPVSIISIQTAAKLGDETGTPPEKRRFRANIYLDLADGGGFHENTFVGRSLRIGAHVVVSVVKRDSRCMMITLHPDTAEKTPAVLKQVAQAHEGTAGVYASVVVEGSVRRGDAVELLD